MDRAFSLIAEFSTMNSFALPWLLVFSKAHLLELLLKFHHGGTDDADVRFKTVILSFFP
ncbi:hypothetical protein ALP04_03614 [Pseudomonas amygdali pv. sesami]|nr:hypothetical protein ALP04_03614 [Pseudomonas amygdali pv. sesami]